MKLTKFFNLPTMDQICRLCLTVSENMLYKLSEESKILDKLSCLNVQILISETLPSSVCYLCTKTLDDILSYRENVLQNQDKLLKQLHNAKTFEFYESLKYRDIKAELDIEDNLDQSFDYESKPDHSRTKKTELEFQIPSKLCEENFESMCCKSIEPNNKMKRDKASEKEKELVKLKKADINEDDTLTTVIRNRKRKTRILESQTMKAKKKLIKYNSNYINEMDSKCDVQVHTKAEEYILDQNKDIKHNNNETGLDKIEDRVLVKTEICENKCLTCFKYLASNLELIKHYRTMHNNLDKENGSIDFVESNNNDENKEIVVEKPRPYNCKVCGRTFTSIYAIIRHARVHSDYSLSCSHGCGYTTAYKGALTDHERRHEKDFRYKCARCGAGFHVKTWYDQHQNTHNNVKPYVCDICGMAFHMNRYLTSHRSSVHAESIKGAKRFCPHCELSFDNTHSFKAHLEEHTGKKKYLCALCGKECSSVEQLKYHNNSHLGLKPFTCSICNKSFAKKFNLTVHQRAHAGEKHLCQECGKHFAQRSTLLRHARNCHPESKDQTNKSDTTIIK